MSQARADRLGAGHAGPGSPLAIAVLTGDALWGTWEDVQLWIMGPRAGKTSCVCIPQVFSAPGPVLHTSNKSDLLVATRGPRSEVGRVWVNDRRASSASRRSGTGGR